jgi:hypothetical protein
VTIDRHDLWSSLAALLGYGIAYGGCYIFGRALCFRMTHFAVATFTAVAIGVCAASLTVVIPFGLYVGAVVAFASGLADFEMISLVVIFACACLYGGVLYGLQAVVFEDGCNDGRHATVHIAGAVVAVAILLLARCLDATGEWGRFHRPCRGAPAPHAYLARVSAPSSHPMIAKML